MCGRYWIDGGNEQLSEIIAGLQRKNPPGLKTDGEIFPGDTAPVICKSRGGSIRPFAMEWGFSLSDGRQVINARSETAAQKPMFRQSMAERRCVLPMSAYFEWEKRGNDRQKYRIRPEADALCCLAGIYRFENGAPRFAVLTAEAADEIAFIHPRMPLILPWAEHARWLSGEDFHWQLRMRFREE